MIKFSWKKINNKLDWNAYSVLEYFFLKEEIKLPSYLNRKIPEKVIRAVAQPYIPGTCFLLDLPTVLVEAKTPNDLYLYLELASKRNIFDYNIRKMTYLSLILVEEYQLDWVSINPLMTIENDKVYFKYEQEKQYVD